jgi:hypothetical protein
LIDYYYPDNVNTTDALIVSMQMVLVGFVLHTVDGVYVAMHFCSNFAQAGGRCIKTWLQEANLQCGWMQ